jgi:hypothetical protein
MRTDEPTPELIPAVDPEATVPQPHRATMCANCGAALQGAYCPRCGQRHRPERISLRHEVARFAIAAFDLDRGVLHTFLRLSRRPAQVVADYLRGRTVPYTHPAKYFLLALALLQLLAYWGGAVGEFTSGLTEQSDLMSESQVALLVDRFFVLLAAPSVLLLAALQRRAFRSASLHYGEHLVLALFVTAQQALIWCVALTASHLLPAAGAKTIPLLALAGTSAYYIWSVHRFFRGSLTANTARGMAVLVLTPPTYTLVVALMIAALSLAGAF